MLASSNLVSLDYALGRTCGVLVDENKTALLEKRRAVAE